MGQRWWPPYCPVAAFARIFALPLHQFKEVYPPFTVAGDNAVHTSERATLCGSITGKGGQDCPGIQIPHLRRVVRRSGYRTPSVRTHRHAIHKVRVTGLPRTAEELVQQLRTELEATAVSVDAAFPTNAAVSTNKDGEPVLKRPAANKPPATAMELEAALQTFLPECSLLDIVWLTNASTRFTRHFGPISGLDAKLDRLDEKRL
jgi:hypothetical protein